MNDIEVRRIWVIIDRMWHHSTRGLDLENSQAGLRRLIPDKPPSEVLRLVDGKASALKAARDAKASAERQNGDLRVRLAAAERQIDDLRQRHADLEAKLATCTRTIVEQQHTIADLRQSHNRPTNDGSYTREDVDRLIGRQFPKRHGVVKSLLHKNAAQRQQGLDIPAVTEGMWQRWRKMDEFPAWAVEQLHDLSLDDLLSRQKWTEDERQYLIGLYSTDPTRSNQYLANACTAKFDRLVTDCAIKGELNRLRQSDRVVRYRRSTDTEHRPVN